VTFQPDVELVVYLYNIEGTMLGKSTVQAVPQNSNDNYVALMKFLDIYDKSGKKIEIRLTVGEPYELVAHTFKNGNQDHVMARSTKYDRVFVPCLALPVATTTVAPVVNKPMFNCTNSPTDGECVLDLPYLLRTSTTFAFQEYIEITALDEDQQRYCYSTDGNGQHMCRSLGACIVRDDDFQDECCSNNGDREGCTDCDAFGEDPTSRCETST